MISFKLHTAARCNLAALKAGFRAVPLIFGKKRAENGRIVADNQRLVL